MREVKLGVNLDHIATIREARKAVEPDPVQAALLAELGGADGITVHLRADRRHIKERDVELLRRTVKTMLNVEMGATDEMVDIALKVLPHQVTLVPERREEITTEGGLDVVLQGEFLKPVISKLMAAEIAVSIFVDPDPEQIRACAKLGITAVEINTGRYAEAEDREKELEAIEKAARLASKLGLRVLAGHGLNYRNVKEIVAIEEIEELSIGHAIVSRAVFVGLKEAVAQMKALLRR